MMIATSTTIALPISGRPRAQRRFVERIHIADEALQHLAFAPARKRFRSQRDELRVDTTCAVRP